MAQGGRGREVAIEHIAVEGMHHHRNAGQPRGDSSQHPRFRRMGVDDLGPHAAQKTVERDQSQQVAPW
jgi:hypothetical protein